MCEYSTSLFCTVLLCTELYLGAAVVRNSFLVVDKKDPSCGTPIGARSQNYAHRIVYCIVYRIVYRISYSISYIV